MKDSKADSKIVILLTDGENNTGFIDPVTAASIANENSIKTYTVGVGSYGTAPYPTKDVFGRDVYVDVPANIDEDMLRMVSDTTGGIYFRADRKSELAKVYKQIEKLQKSDIEELKFYNIVKTILSLSSKFKIELERVRPRLKVHGITNAKEWRSEERQWQGCSSR